MPTPRATADLIERGGDLKRELIEFSGKRRFRRHFEDAVAERLGEQAPADEGAIINVRDYFALEYRPPDGHTIVERFVADHPKLPDAERAMLLGWRDVVEGIFAIQRRDGDALVLFNLVDELTYRARSNIGPDAVDAFPVGSFLVARLVPVGGDWMLSGAQSILPRSSRADVHRIAARLAASSPRLVFRNPERLARAWELQHSECQAFVDFFGSDLVVLPGAELPERMRAYMHYLMFERRDEAGKTAADGAGEDYGKVPAVPEVGLPDNMIEAETVGIIYDEVDGMNLFPDFGLVADVFANPDLVDEQPHRETLLAYLEHPGFIPLPLRRLADGDPERASRVFQRLLKRRDFSWDRDGDALLRRHKASYYATPVLPSVTPLSDAQVKSHLSERAGHRVGRNDPCPCGSGKKYKRCHGASGPA